MSQRSNLLSSGSKATYLISSQIGQLSNLTNKTKYKLVILGNSTVGKTSIVQRFKKKEFSEKTDLTIGASFVNITLSNITLDKKYNYNIWDTAGQERYKMLSQMYYREANIIILVFNVMDFETLKLVDYYRSLINANLEPNSYKIIIVGNKKDLITDQMLELIEINILELYPDLKNILYVSAKTNEGIEDLVNTIVKLTTDIIEYKILTSSILDNIKILDNNNCKCLIF
jgi:Ras-related protein Rab-5C